MKNSKAAAGVFWSFLSAFLWATTYIVARVLMKNPSSDIDPETLSLVRFAVGGGLLWCIAFITDRKALFDFKIRDYFNLALLGVFAYVGMSVLLFKGMQYTEAVNSSMIMGCSPVMTMLIGLLVGIKISAKQSIGMVISTIGGLIVVGVITLGGWQFVPGALAGDGLVLLAALSWAVSTVLAAKLLKGRNELAITSWSMVFAALILFVMSMCRPQGISLPETPMTWGYVLYIGIFATALAFFAWNSALSRISVNLVSIMQYLTQVMTLIMAYFILDESLGWFKLAGVVMVLGGMAFFSGKNNGSNKCPTAEK